MRRFRRKNRFLKVWGKKTAATLLSSLLLACLGSGSALANPTDGQVRSGTVNISTVGPNSLHIEQLTQKAIIDWQSFGINPGEAVRFLQPNQLSVILNRVVGQDPSKILGELSANGNVWLINPNGVLFGPGSTVNVGGLVASTLNISNEDFLNGNYRFMQDVDKPLASVVNQGTITITDGGYAVLMAPLVSNEGLIVANLGQVNLLSGESATLNFDGRNLVSYDIGKMDSKAGTVLLSRDTVSTLLANVITSPVLTEAGKMVENDDGSVSLVAASGTTINEGSISTNGANGQKAGKIVLDSGRLTVVGPEAVVEASGSGPDSDGGSVLALSDGFLYTSAGSQLKAQGSDQGGDGGFVETSGKNFIINSVANVGAAAGKAGEWLIDPEFLTIIEGPNGSGGLDGQSDTTGLGGQVNTISTDFLKSITSGTVTLQADNQITISDLSTNAFAFSPDVSVTFETKTGDLLFVDRADKLTVSGTGNLSFDIGRDIYLGVVENTGSGKIEFEYGTDGSGKLYADSTSRVIGDNLVFHNANTDLGVYDDPDDTTIAALGIKGAGSNVSPKQLELNMGDGKMANLVTSDSKNLTLTAGGALSSGDLRAVGTDVTINKTGNLALGDFTAKEATITATGTVNGDGTASTVDLTADKAVVTGSALGGSNATRLGTSVKQLEIESTGNMRIGVDDSALTDLTVRSTNSLLAVTTNSVATENIVASAGTTTTISNLNKPSANFSFYENHGSRQAEVGDITAKGVDLNFAGSISNVTSNATDTITASTVTLTTRNAGANIGASGAPINVATGAAVTTKVNNGVVDLATSDGGTLKHDATGLLTASKGSGTSFSSVAFENTGTNVVTVGKLGDSGSALTQVSITGQGNVLDNQNDGNSTNVGDVNIFADKVRLTSTGGSVGTTSNPIETSAKQLSGDSTGGTNLANVEALDVFEIVTDTADSSITAANGTVKVEGGVLTATGSGGTGSVNTAGTSTGTVTVDVTSTSTTGITLGSSTTAVNIGDSSAVTPTATLNVTATKGDITTGVVAQDIIATNTAINLTAKGDVGTPTGKIAIDLSGTSTVSVNAGANPAPLIEDGTDSSSVGVNITGTAPKTLSVAHDNGEVDVTVTGGGSVTNDASNNLSVKGVVGTDSISYTKRGDSGGDTKLADGAVDTINQSNIDITTKGSITRATGASEANNQIRAVDKTVSVSTEGDLATSASSAGSGSLALKAVARDATITNNGNLTVKGAAAPGENSVGRDLTIHNGASTVTPTAANETLQVGSLKVGRDATITNDGTITGTGTSPNLSARYLSVTTTATDTSLDLDTSVSRITIDDTVANDSDGTVIIDNDKSLDRVTVDSQGSDQVTVGTTNAPAGTLSYGDNGANSGDSVLTASNPDIGTLRITEHQNNIVAGDGTNPVNLANASTTNSYLTTTAANASITSAGNSRITTNDAGSNLTLQAAGEVNVKTDVSGTLDITSQAEDITFHDNDAGGPDEIRVNTVAGKDVNGSWGPDAGPRNTLTYQGDGDDSFDIAGATGATNSTDVVFETGKGNIVIGQADVGNGIANTARNADLTLKASDTSAGHIYDKQDDDALSSPDIDVIARNATLLAHGNIGADSSNAVRRLETEVPEKLEARSETGAVNLDSTTQSIDHLIIDVIHNDYNVRFKNKAGQNVVVDYDIQSPTGGALTVSGASTSTVGTDLTLIERDKTTTVDINSNVNSGDKDFVRVIAGGGITNLGGDSTITAGFVDLVSEGNIGTATDAIRTKTSELNLDVRGKNKNAYVANDGDLTNLILNVDQDGAAASGEAAVNVAWKDEENSNAPVGMSVVNTLVSSQANVNVGGSAVTTTRVNDAQVYVSNGLLEISGTLGVAPKPESFHREAKYQAGTGGNLAVGTYTAVDTAVPSNGPTNNAAPYLQLTAKKNGSLEGSITQNATGAGIDIAGGTVTLVADGDIGTNTQGVKVATNTAAGKTNTVNAYTGGGNPDGNDIRIEGTGTGHITYNEVYAGTDLSGVVPPTYNVIDRAKDVNVPNFAISTGSLAATPGQHAGDVDLRSAGSMDAKDIVAGTTAKNDGNITLTAANNVNIGKLKAEQDTVAVTVTGDGNITEITGDNTGKVFAQTFDAEIQGTGNIGSGAAGNGPLDLVVNTVDAKTNNGAISLRNIGQVEWRDVESNAAVSPTANGDIYLVSEGAAFARKVVAGDNANLLVETKSGSDLLVGDVEAKGAGATATLKSSDRIRSDLTGATDPNRGRVAAEKVLLLADRGIGVNDANAADPLKLQAGTVAGSSQRGSIYLEEVNAGGNLTVGTVSNAVSGVSGLTADGLSAKGTGQDVHVDVKNGSLSVEKTIEANRNVALRTAGTSQGIMIGSGTGDTTTVIKAGTTASLQATGAVTDNNADGTAAVEAANVVVDANSLTKQGGGQFEVKADIMAVKTVNNTIVKDLTGNLTIGQLNAITPSSATPGATITGSTSSDGDICYEAAAGALTISNAVTADKESIGLKASTNVVANADVTAEKKISVHAVNGGITGSGLLQTEATGSEIVLRTQNTIGTSSANGLDISTDKLAAVSTNGSVFIDALALNRSTTTDRNLEIATVQTINCGEAAVNVTGVTSAPNQQISINVPRGALKLTERVGSSTSGQESSVVALRARDDIDLNNGTHNGVVARDKISIESLQGGLLNSNPSTGPALETINSNGQVVIRTKDDIAASGGTGIKVQTEQLAAESTHGDVKIVDLTGNLTVGQLTLEADGGTVTGVKAGTATDATEGDVCVQVEQGNLNLTRDVTAAHGSIGLKAQGNINLQTGANEITALNKVSVYSETGVLDGVGLLKTTTTSTTTPGEVVIRTAGDVGTSSQALRVDTDKLAARSTTGNVYLQAEGGDVTVARLVSTNCNDTPETVNGILSGANKEVMLNVTAGKLTLDAGINNGTDTATTVGLRAGNGDIALNNNVLKAKDKISLEATGSLTETSVPGTFILETTNATTSANGGIVAKTGGSIGSAADPLRVQTDKLAAESVNGSVDIVDSTGDLTVGTGTLVIGSGTVNGVRALNDINLAANQTLNVSANVESRTTGGNVVVTAGDQILDTTQASGAIIGTNVVLDATNGIGASASPAQVNATNFAAKTTTGDIRVQDTAGGMTVAENVAGIATADGVTAPGVIDISTVGGTGSTLTVAADITSASGDVALSSTGNVVLGDAAGDQNGLVTAGTNISVTAGGNITDGNAANPNLIARGGANVPTNPAVGGVTLTAGNSVGSATDFIDIQAGQLAVTATGGQVNVVDTTGDLEVTGVTARTPVRLSATGTGADMNITGQIRSTANGLVHLTATGDIKDSVSGSGSTGNAAVNTGGNLVLQANTLSSAATSGAFEIATAGLAGRITTGDVTIQDLTGSLNVANTTVFDGLVAGDGNICLTVNANNGDLVVNEEVTSVNKNVALKAGQNITVNSVVTAEDKISAHAVTGNITGSGTGRLLTETTNLDGEMILRAGGNVGTNATTGALRVSTDKLAAQAGGDVYVRAEAFDTATPVTRDLTITELNSFNCGETPQAVTGVLSGAGRSIAVDVEHGKATLDKRVGSSTSGQESSVVALRARDDIDLNNGTHNGVVARDKISLESVTGGLSSINPSSGAALRTTQTGGNGEIVIRTNNDIKGDTGSLSISTDKLAAESKIGDVSITDLDGNLTVGTGVLETGTGDVVSRTVTGVKAGNDGNTTTTEDVCLQVAGTGGTLTITQAVEAQNGKIAVAAQGNIVVDDNSTTTDGRLDARDKISVSSVNGGLSGQGLLRTAATTPDNTDPALRGGIVIKTRDSIGTSSNPGDVVRILTDKFAAESTAGSVYVQAQNSNLLVTSIGLQHCDTSLNTTVTGVTSAEDQNIALDVQNGSLTLDQRVGSLSNQSATVALRARDDISIAGNTLGLVAAKNTVSVESVTGSLLQPPGTGPAIQTGTGGTAVIRTQGNIQLEIDADNLAAQSGGNIDITNSSGDLTVTTANLLTGPLANRQVVGVNAVGDVKLTVDDTLHVNADIKSQAPAGDVLVTAGDKILDSSQASGTIIGTNVVLGASNGIGASGSPVQVDATNFSASTTAGDIRVQDIAGGMTVAENVAGIATADGVTASGLIDISTVGGAGNHLTVAANITSTTGDVALSSTGNVVLGDAADNQDGRVTAGTNISVTAGGSITDGNGTNPNLIARGGANVPTDPAVGRVTLTAGSSIGTDTDFIDIQAGQLAATATSGSANITDTTGDLTVAGVTARDDARISTTGSGANMNITGQIQSTNSGLVQLTATNNIIDAVSGAAVNTAGNLVVTSTTGSVSGGVDVNGEPTAPFEVEASGLQANAAKGIAVKDLDTANNGLNINGTSESADGNVCVQTAGVLTVSQSVTAAETAADKGKIALRGEDGVVINAAVSADKKVSVLADAGSITGSGTLSTTTSGTANGVVLSASGDIGASGANRLRINTDKVAASSTNGGVYLQTTGADRNLTVAELTPEVCGVTSVAIPGVKASTNVEIDVVDGNLNISKDVESQTGSVGLRASGDQGGDANDIVIGDGSNGQVKAAGTVSLEAAGKVEDNNGAAKAAVVTPGTLVVRGDSLVGNTGPFETEVATLAAQTTGDMKVKDLTGNLTVGSGTTILGNTATTGATSSDGNICIQAADGTLTITQAVSANDVGPQTAGVGKVALAAKGDVVINSDGTGSPANAGAVNADEKISIYSETGGLVRVGTTNGVLTTNAATNGEVVINTFKSIGAEGQAVRVNTDKLAAQSRNTANGDGNVAIEAVQNKALTISELTAEHCDPALNTAITGIQSGTGTGNKVLVNVTNGDLILDKGINNGTDRADTVGLRAEGADGDVALNDNVLKAKDKISIEASGTGSLTETSAPGTVILETTNATTSANGGIVLKTGDDIASVSDPLLLQTDKLAAQSTAGDVYIKETATKPLTISNIALEHGGGFVAGVIGDDTVALQTTGDLAVGTGASVSTTDTSTSSIVSLDVSGNLTDSNAANQAAVSTAGTVVVNAASVTGAGGTGAFEIAANTLAAQATNNITVKDVDNSKGLTIGQADLVLTDKTPKTVTGVTSTDGNICINEVDQNLTVSQAVSAPKGSVGLQAGQDIILNAAVTADNTVSLLAGGTVSGTSTVGSATTDAVVIKTAGDIGSTGTALNINAGKLAAESTAGNVYLQTTGNVVVTELNLVNCGTNDLVSGIKAEDVVRLQVAGDLTVGETGKPAVISTRGTQTTDSVTLTANGNVIDNNGTGVAAVNTAGNLVVTSTTGSVSGGVDVNGEPTAPFEVEASGLQANAAKGIAVKDLDTANNGLNINGTSESADGNVCVQTAGVLTVSQSVTAAETAADKGKIALRGEDGVVINAAVSADKKVSVLADAGSITGSGTLSTTTSGTANGVVLSASGDIGASGANRLRINTDKVAASSTNGGVYLQTTGADRNLTVAELTPEVCGVTSVAIPGVKASTNVEIDVVDGNLNISKDVESQTGSVGLRASGDQGGDANDIVIGDGSNGQVKAAGTVSLEAAGKVEDNNGAAKAAVVTPGTLVVRGDSLVGNTGPFETEVATLAAQTTGDMKVKDLTGNLTVGSGTTILGNTATTGATSSDGNICIQAADGTLTITQAVSANDAGPQTTGVGKVGLSGKDGIVLNAAISADEKISLYSQDGGLSGSSQSLTTNAPSNGEVVIKTRNSIGSASAPLNVTTNLLAAESTDGSVYLNSTQDLTIADLVLEVCGVAPGTSVTGVTANGEVGVAAAGNLTIGQGDPTAGRVVAVTSTNPTNNTVSLEATGNIVDNNGADNAAVVTPGTVVVRGASVANNSGGQFEVKADTLAAQTTGDLKVKDLTGNLTIGSGTTILGNTATTGATSSDGNICIEAADGTLTVSQTVSANDAGPQATGVGKVGLTGRDGIVLNAAVNADEKISLYSQNGGISGSSQSLTTNAPSNGEVVIKTMNSIGSATAPLNVTTNLLAAESTAGSVYLNSTQDLTIADLILEVCGVAPNTHVTGIVSNSEVGVAVAGDLTIGRDSGDVSAPSITANGTVSLEATGKVEDNNGSGNAAVVTPGTLVVVADTLTGDRDMDSGNPAAPGQPNNAFEVKTGGLAAEINSGNAAVVSLDGDLTVTRGTTVLNTTGNPQQTVTGVTTPGDFYLDVKNGALKVDENITTTSGDIALAAKDNITLGTTDGTTPRGVLTVTGGGQTVSVESRNGAILDGHKDADAPGALINIDNKGGDVVLFSATGVGGTEPDTAGLEGEIEIDAQNFAGNGGSGDIKVRDLDTDMDGLNLTNLITLIDEKTVNSISATHDIYLTIDHSDINVNTTIVAGGDVALRTQTGNIDIGAQIVAGNISKPNKVGTVNLITEGGSITNSITDGTTAIVAKGNGTTPGGDIVLVADGSIGAGNAITTDTGRLAADSETGSVSIIEVDQVTKDGLKIDAIPTLQNVGTVIDGVHAETGVCIDVKPGASGDLVVKTRVLSDSQNIGLQSQEGDILIENGASVSATAAGKKVSMIAKGEIASANDPATTTSITSENVAMVAGTGIGNSKAIGIEAVNLAAKGGTGDVNIVDRDGNGLTITTLNVDVCHPSVPVTTVTGITTDGKVTVDVTGGNLNINDDITATNGGVALRAQDGDIVIGDDDSATGSNADTITAGGKVSLEAADGDTDGNGGAVTDNNGQGNPAVVTPGNLVIVADKAGGTNDKALEIQAGGLAATTTETLKVKDLTGDLKTVTDTTTLGGQSVDGVTSTNGNVCLEVVQGALDIAEGITSSNGDVRVRANGNVTLSGTDNVSAKNTLAVSSATGEIRDTNSGDFAGDLVVLSAATGIGNSGVVSLQANTLAANGGTGNVNVIDMTGDLEIGRYVGALICDGPSTTIVGLSGAGQIVVEVPNGSLTFTEGVNNNPGDPTATLVALKAKDEIDLKGHTIVAQDKISIESQDGGLIGTTQDGQPDLRTTNTNGNGQVVIKTKDNINLEIATDKLAAQSTNGSVTIKDLTGNLIVTELDLEKGGGKVDGVRAKDGVCLEVTQGSLEIAEGISSTNGNVKVRANGDVTLAGSDGISSPGQVVVSSATGQLINNGTGDLVGDTVVLVGATGVGNTRDFTLRANTLAANGGTGSVNVIDRDGGLVIGSFTGSLICGGPTETVTGVKAGGNIGIEVPGGPLIINNPIAAGGIVAIKTGGDIESNAKTSGGSKVSLESGGSIKDGTAGNDPNFEAPQIVIKAAGDIGDKANPLEINSDKVAAASTNGGVYLTETTGNLNVGTIDLEKNGGTVSGITGKTKVELYAPDGTVTYNNSNPIKAGDSIFIKTRDTLVLSGTLEAGNRICIDVTNGDILDNNDGVDIRTAEAVLRAQGSIGTVADPVDLDVDRLAAEAILGSVILTEKNGLTITTLEMCNGGGTIPGVKAGTEVRITVLEGDLEVKKLDAGKDVTLETVDGSINGVDNIKAGGDITIIEGGRGARTVLIDLSGAGHSYTTALVPGLRPALPPGLFAQDNVALGVYSFYLDVLYDYLTPEEIALIVNELERYNYLEDEDFLLEKHPNHKGKKKDEHKAQELQSK